MHIEYHYSMREAAERIGCHYSCLRAYVKQGKIRPTKYTTPDAAGYRWLFSEKDIAIGRRVYERGLSRLKVGLRAFVERKRTRPATHRALREERRRSGV
jgi:DNA-binding transcriptional MerR regulator